MSNEKTSRKKLLFVLSSLSGGGAERVVIHLLNNLDRTKYDLKLVIFDNKRDYKKDINSDLPILCLDKKNRWDFLKLVFKLKKIVKDHKPDFILSALMYTNIITVFACLGLKRDFKVIISEHIHTENFLKYEKFSGFKKILIKFAYNKADKIVAVSKGIKKVLEEKFYIASDNITVIYNPIPLEEIKVKMSAPVECKFFSEGNNSIIIGVGRLERQKRFDILLKAFALAIKEVNSARLIILGQGNLQEELKKLAVNLKIDSQVYFGGFQANSYAWISKADLFVLSSDYEGFPMSILEAMACGIPVISSDCLTGPNEIIVNGENGILVPQDDVAALAKEMLVLMKDPILRTKLSCYGQKRVEDFEMGKIISQYELLLL